MASRQNREARAEYPTGHQPGNDSPDRSVPRVPVGANPVEKPDEVGIRAFGAPIGTPKVSEEDQAKRIAERETKLETPGTREEFQAEVTRQEEGSIEETKRAELEMEADRRTAAAEPSATVDLSAAGAAKTLEEMKRRTEEAGR